jgi:F-type H+-transporting ATPase subunit b
LKRQKKRETQLVEEAAVKANAEKEKILAAGHAEIETERNQAKEELRQQVAALAVVGAEKILERSIDAAAHSDILDKLVAEL